jgi:hypothetical protein
VETVTWEIGQTPRVHITSIGSDLRIVGRDGSSLEAQVPTRGDLDLTREADGVTLAARSGCLLFLPSHATLEVDSVGGDARVSAIAGKVRLTTIGGDLDLRGLSGAQVTTVGSDLHGSQLAGAVAAESVGGDVRLLEADGPIHLGTVNGDVLLRRIRGEVRVSAGGDIRLECIPPAGSRSTVHAGGDVQCRFPADASLHVAYSVRGDVSINVPWAQTSAGGTGEVTFGAGEARIDLEVGGDLQLEAGDGAGAPAAERGWRQDLEARVEAQVEAALSEMERGMRFGGVASGLREDITEQIRQSMGRARRRPHRLGRHGEAAEAGRKSGPSGEVGSEAAGVGEAERLAILKMVESGKISVDEAEKLFQAMEGGE